MSPVWALEVLGAALSEAVAALMSLVAMVGLAMARTHYPWPCR